MTFIISISNEVQLLPINWVNNFKTFETIYLMPIAYPVLCQWLQMLAKDCSHTYSLGKRGENPDSE